MTTYVIVSMLYFLIVGLNIMGRLITGTLYSNNEQPPKSAYILLMILFVGMALWAAIVV